MSAFKIIPVILIIVSLFSACTFNQNDNENFAFVNSIEESVLLNELSQNENYYTTDSYCYLALYNDENNDIRKFYIGDTFKNLTLSGANVTYFYYDTQLYIDMLYAEFSGEISLSGYMYKLNEGINTGLYFTPDKEMWNGLPMIYGKHDNVPVFWIKNTEDWENSKIYNIPDDETPVLVELTLSNILMKWNNGSASGSPDVAELVSINFIAN